MCPSGHGFNSHTFRMDNDYDHSSTLMWPVPEIDTGAHVTVLYCGEDLKLKLPPWTYLKMLRGLAEAPGAVAVTGTEVFGEGDNRVWVATLDDTELGPLRADIKRFCYDILGFQDASSYPDYRPHVTLGPWTEGSEAPEVPESFDLGALEFWIGNDHHTL